jgi:hypothetical protein
MGIVKANDHVVAVQRVHEDFCVKIITIDPRGRGIKPIIFTGEATARREQTTAGPL